MAYRTMEYNQMKQEELTWKNSYTIWDEEKRNWLNERIERHFYFREIGFRNPKRFDWELGNRLEEIMTQKYNRLMDLLSVEFNPLYNIDLTETETYTRQSDNTLNNKKETINKILSTFDNTTTNEMINKMKQDGVVKSSDEKNNSFDSATTNTTNENNEQSVKNKQTTKATTNSGGATMPDDLTTDSVYYDTRTQSENNGVSDGENIATASGVSSNESNVKNNETETSTANSTTQINNETTNKTTVSNGGTSNNDEKSSENIDSVGSNIEKFTHETKTLGSSAGLSFANAVMQYQKMISESDVLKMIYSDLESLFLGVWCGDDYGFY